MTKQDLNIFGRAILFRSAIYLLSLCVMAVFGNYAEGISLSDFLESWKRWDSAHYINIAQNGYAGAAENGEHLFLVFYPLYPWLMRVLSFVLKDFRLCGMLVSVICYAVGCVYFYKLTELETDARTAENALILLSVFPFSFFFGAIATESLFFAIGAPLLYCIRTHRWKSVAALGCLACLTKVQGLLFAFAVLAELLYHEQGFRLLRNREWKAFFKKIILPGCVAALMLIGFLVYLLINYIVEGDPFRFLYYQRNHWFNSLCPMWVTLSYLLRNAAKDWHSSSGMSIWVPEILLFAGYLTAIAYGIRRRLRPMYMVYLAAFFLLTYSSTWLLSAGRYTLSALPLFMLAGIWVTRHEKSKIPLIVLSSMMMAVYMTGYYSWKQIM